MTRILFIDDDIDDRDIFRDALKMLEYKTEYMEAQDGQEALELLTQPGFVPPDVIFVDLNMPRVTGLEFIIRARQLPQYQYVPMYVYTTSASPRERVNCMSAGATGYIIKHINYADLSKELDALISKLKVA